MWQKGSWREWVGGHRGWEGEGWCDLRLTVGWGLFLGSVRQCGVSMGQVCCLGYQHPDTDAKTAQTGETIRRKGEMERPPVWVTLFHGYCSPLERWRHGKKGKEGGLKNETAKRKENALASVGGWGGVCYDMEIPACWSCWPVWGFERQEGLRVQPGCLLPGASWSQDTRNEPVTDSCL